MSKTRLNSKKIYDGEAVEVKERKNIQSMDFVRVKIHHLCLLIYVRHFYKQR